MAEGSSRFGYTEEEPFPVDHPVKQDFPLPDEGPVDISDALGRSDKDNKFIQLFSASGFDINRRQEFAVAAGFTPGRSARGHAGRIIKSLANNKAMQRALKRHGVDNNKLAQKMMELLDCEHPQFKGRPDNMAQIKAVEMSLRVKDAFPPTKVEVDKSEHKEIVISGEVIQRLERYDRLKVIDCEDVTVHDRTD
jgi:hypothetical protein